MKLNREEILTGIAYSIVWLPFQGVCGFVSAILSGFLWAYGGAAGTSKNWRRIGCPLVICLPILPVGLIILLTGLLLHLTLRIGYGTPTFLSDGTCIDSGSQLGRIWWHLCGGGNYPCNAVDRQATIGVRTTVAVLAALCFLPLAWVNLYLYIIGSMLLTVFIPIIVDRT